jgi:hypothetical protein
VGQLVPAEKLGAAKETSIGFTEYEAGSLSSQGVKGVAVARLVEVKSNSAAEAIAVVREKYTQNAGGERAVVKPNTNFKVVV